MVAGQLVYVACMAVPGDDFCRGSRVIRTGGRGDFAFTGRANKYAVLQRGRCARQIVFGVPAVTQQGVRDAGLRQRLLRRDVFNVQTQRRFIRMQQAGIGDELHARGFGSINDVLMLGGALTHFAGGDQQQLIYALKRGGHCAFVSVIPLTNGNSLLAQGFSFCRIADNRHNLVCRYGV